jgi:hypothetical protein
LFDPPGKIDPLSFPAAEGTDPPRLSVTGTGDALAAVGLSLSHQTIVSFESENRFAPPQRLDGVSNAISPQPVPALAGSGVGLVAWEQSAGPSDPPTLRGRVIDSGSFGPEVPLSRPELGAVDTGAALSAGVDRLGDVAVVFLQGGALDHRISAATLVQPPKRFDTEISDRWRRGTRPRLHWSPSADPWSPVVYKVVLDGTVLGTTPETSFLAPAPIPDGVHRLQIVATDRHGQERPAPSDTLRIDTTPPTVSISVRGKRLDVHVHDPPARNATGKRQGSGVARVQVSFGDKHSITRTGDVNHRYRHGGHFAVRVQASDHAGNQRVVRKRITVR